MASDFGAALKQARSKKGLTQVDLAASCDLSRHTIPSYERGARLPASPSVVMRLAAALECDPRPLLAAAGFPGEPVPAEAHVRMSDLAAAAERYRWPCLLNNENLEVVGMNAPARALAAFDLAPGAEPGSHHLLRLALDPHTSRGLLNADQIIGELASILKGDGVDVCGPAQGPRFMASVVAWLSRQEPATQLRLMQIYAQTPQWEIGRRMSFVARWLTTDGVNLQFNCLITPWNNLLGVWAFDWDPADPLTWEWFAEASAPPAPPSPGWPECIAERRQAYGYTRAEFAALAGVSPEAVYFWERGRRRPSHTNLTSLVQSTGIDGATAGLIVDALGYEPVPSAAYRYLRGETIETRPDLVNLNVVTITAADIQRSIDRHPWPAIVIDESGAIACANSRSSWLNLDQPGVSTPTGTSIIELVTHPAFRSGCESWDEFVPFVTAFAESLLPRKKQPSPFPFGARLAGQSAHDLQRAVAAFSPDRTGRAFVRFRWRTPEASLAFNCVVSPWNIWDPFAAIDLHPANAETWMWLAARYPSDS